MQEWKKRLTGPLRQHPPPQEAATSPLKPIVDDDEGILDLAETIQDDLASLNSSISRINQGIKEVGEQVATSAQSMEAMTASGTADPKRFKRLLSRTASDVEQFATRVQSEIPTFSTVYDRVVSAVSRAAILQSSIPGATDPIAEVI